MHATLWRRVSAYCGGATSLIRSISSASLVLEPTSLLSNARNAWDRPIKDTSRQAVTAHRTSASRNSSGCRTEGGMWFMPALTCNHMYMFGHVWPCLNQIGEFCREGMLETPGRRGV